MKEIQAYLTFDGNCREAMSFYHQCLGGTLDVATFGEANIEVPPEARDHVLHARLENGSTVLMASDTMPGMPIHQGNNVFMSIVCETDEEVDGLYAKMVEGGKGIMPPEDAFWGARFAMFTDRFGMNWMLNHAHTPA